MSDFLQKWEPCVSLAVWFQSGRGVYYEGYLIKRSVAVGNPVA